MLKQICDGYNPKVLMGNWHQEGYSLQQPCRKDNNHLPRTYEIDIGFKDNHGNLMALNRISRLKPWNTKGLLQINHSNKQNKTVMKSAYDLKTVQNFHQSWVGRPFCKQNKSVPFIKPSVQLQKVKQDYLIFNKNNVGELNVERQVDTKTFKSNIKPNNYSHSNILLQTTYQKGYNQINSNSQYLGNTQSNKKQTNKQVNFMRKRSDITLKKFPQIITYK